MGRWGVEERGDRGVSRVMKYGSAVGDGDSDIGELGVFLTRPRFVHYVKIQGSLLLFFLFLFFFGGVSIWWCRSKCILSMK